MKIAKLATMFALAFVLAATSLYAQSAPVPATPPVNHFVLTANVAGFAGMSGSPGTATILTAGMQIMPRVSLNYAHIAVGGARWELGVGAYSLPLSSLLGSKISSKFLFDASKITVTATAGAGKLLQPTNNQIAETMGVHISYPLGDHVSVQVVGVDWLHSAHVSGLLTTNTNQAISSGLNFYF